MFTNRIKYKTAAILTLSSLVTLPVFAGGGDDAQSCASVATTGGIVMEDGAVMLVGQAVTGKSASNDFVAHFGTIHCLTSGAGPVPCPADVDGSGEIDVIDLLQLLAEWGPCVGCESDINNDGQVDVVDLLALLAAWGPC